MRQDEEPVGGLLLFCEATSGGGGGDGPGDPTDLPDRRRLDPGRQEVPPGLRAGLVARRNS